MSDNKEKKFVGYVLDKIHKNNDKGFAAKLKKADNEATEYQSWEILASWVDIEKKGERRAYGLIGANLARSQRGADGELGLGEALLKTVTDQSSLEKSPATARLRRVLACKDSLELIQVLRPNLRFLNSKEIGVSHSRLLHELLWFNLETTREKFRAKWAGEFFGKPGQKP